MYARRGQPTECYLSTGFFKTPVGRRKALFTAMSWGRIEPGHLLYDTFDPMAGGRFDVADGSAFAERGGGNGAD